MYIKIFEKNSIRLWLVSVLLFLSTVIACASSVIGNTCEMGAVDITIPVNMERAEEILVEANVEPAGSFWPGTKDIHVFYGKHYPILLHLWPNGMRIQIAVKSFKVRELNASDWNRLGFPS